ncbi:hypothetical protein D4764_0274380 [Takifugu flavidus]|uniref:Resistance to inhibitors of cholinesterase protein 3 N-terminal domain-containing protein n=1 Tax=Takifugu flavidus TaxID=433684 RepID=A0A5C6MMH8_9TELE|nr:hypothetical protein D4764_0274380 [Takifugu flavidus]
MNAPGPSQSAENLQQMKKLMEQELKNDKYKANSNKGYVFTLMPLYAIGVGVFAAYKFLKMAVAWKKKDEIVSQLQTIQYLMKRGMKSLPLIINAEEYDFGPGHLEKIMDKKDHTNTKGGWKKKMGSSKKKDWIGLN